MLWPYLPIYISGPVSKIYDIICVLHLYNMYRSRPRHYQSSQSPNALPWFAPGPPGEDAAAASLRRGEITGGNKDGRRPGTRPKDELKEADEEGDNWNLGFSDRFRYFLGDVCAALEVDRLFALSVVACS